ncbi:MAG: NUDIX hydrolase [Methanobacteriota archaeon]|nr:MAG: NUDIX hydrolase [Euryarchaeota archaeon]
MNLWGGHTNTETAIAIETRLPLSLSNDNNLAAAPRRGKGRISLVGLCRSVIHVTATGLVVKDGRVLLGKRTSTVRFAGMWDAFGGHLVPCEEPSNALVRELEEELGIKVDRPLFLGIYEDIDPTSRDLFRHYLFLVTRWDGEPRITNEEHSEIRWFTPGEAIGLNVAPSLKESIGRMLSTKP